MHLHRQVSAHERFPEVPYYYSAKVIHRIRNVLANSLLRIRSCRIAQNLGDHGTWLPIRLAVVFIRSLCLQLPSTVLSLLHNPGSSGGKDRTGAGRAGSDGALNGGSGA